MGQVAITLNGRTYTLACRDGEEERLHALADHVRTKVDQLVADFGQIGNERVMLMSALLIADELFEVLEDGSPGDADVQKTSETDVVS